MIEYILAILIILSTFLFYTCHLRPKRTQEWYTKTIQDLGYKVKVIPFKAFTVPIVQLFTKHQKQQGDIFYMYKNQCEGYDVMIYCMFNSVLITIFNPELIKTFFTPENVRIYHKDETMIRGLKVMLGANGLVFTEGEKWKHQRKLVSQVFNFDLLKANIPKICSICDESLEAYETQYKNQHPELANSGEFSFYMLEIGARIFSHVMLKCFLGSTDLPTETDGKNTLSFVLTLFKDVAALNFNPLLLLFGNWVVKVGITAKIRDLNRRMKIYNGMLLEKIAERRQQIEKNGIKEQPTDMIEAIVSAHKKEERPEKLTDQSLLEQLSAFMFAGPDTTSHFLMMMIYYIDMNPHVEERLRSEIDKIIKSNQDYTLQNLKKFEYIEWIQKETTRLYGPGNGIMIRKSTEDNLLKDIPIKKGTLLTIITYPNHFSDKFFIKPHEFRPERWEGQSKNIDSFILVGFGAGARTCVGKQLAMLQSKIALIKLIKRYRKIAIPDDKKIKMEMIITTTYEPAPFETKYIKA